MTRRNRHRHDLGRDLPGITAKKPAYLPSAASLRASGESVLARQINHKPLCKNKLRHSPQTARAPSPKAQSLPKSKYSQRIASLYRENNGSAIRGVPVAGSGANAAASVLTDESVGHIWAVYMPTVGSASCLGAGQAHTRAPTSCWTTTGRAMVSNRDAGFPKSVPVQRAVRPSI